MSFDIPRLTEITLDNFEALGTGAGTLNTGGGGNPHPGRLRFQTPLEDDAYPGSVELVDPRDLPPDTTAASVGGMGAPTISVGKFASGDEGVQSLRAIEEPSGETVDALIPGEISGANSMTPLCMAAMTDLLVVDADGIGQAFPELQMDTFFIYGMPMSYAAMTDKCGSWVAYRDIDSAKRLEDPAWAVTVQMDDRSDYTFPLMTGASVPEYAVPHTVPFVTELGRVVEHARDADTDPVDVSHELLGGEKLFAGRTVDTHRRNRNGFVLGGIMLAGLDEDTTLEIELQNEFLAAWGNDGGFWTAMPGLTCLVNTGTGVPVTADTLRYNQHVRVLGASAPELLATPEALDVTGPEAFGYEVPCDPLPWDETGW